MDINKVLAELREERSQLEEAILILERLARGRGRMPPAVIRPLSLKRDRRAVHGSVMQHYEFEVERALTDKEWLERLDADPAPSIPDWLAPFASTPVKLRGQQKDE